VTSFFGIKGAFFVFFSKNATKLRQNFFQRLGENTRSLQPALKSNAPPFKLVLITKLVTTVHHFLNLECFSLLQF